MKAAEKLDLKFSQGKHICVGLDTDPAKIPAHLKNEVDAIYLFNKGIVEATIQDAAAYKLNFAFYECHGPAGMEAMRRTVELIRSLDPAVAVIGDAKRGDIGNTSTMYANAIFNIYGFDCSTLAPYMGKDSLDPFFAFSDRINFVLVLTSNPGSRDFEKLELSTGGPLYREVLRRLRSWYPAENLGMVFGATNKTDLENDIAELKDNFILLPGVGAQGGSASEISSVFRSAGHSRFLINSSRNVIYASSGDDFAGAAANELRVLNSQTA